LGGEIFGDCLKSSKQVTKNKINYVFLFLAPGSVFFRAAAGDIGLFTALQTIPRIWGYKMAIRVFLSKYHL